MIVARSFSPPSSSFMSEKNDRSGLDQRTLLRQRSKSPRRSTASPSRVPTIPPQNQRSDPVRIPPRSHRNTQLQIPPRSAPIAVKVGKTNEAQVQAFKTRKQSAQELLSATAIPRRKLGRPSQRLPKGDHVAEFSKLLFDDIQASKENFGRMQSLPIADGLFGNIDELVEGQIIVESDSLDEGSLSVRSISSDSIASLGSPDDYGFSHTECRSTTGRSVQGRLTPRISHAEDCSADHPLVELDQIDDLSLSASELSSGSTPVTSNHSRTTSPTPRQSKKDQTRSSFKSALSSSLKALKSAARTTLFSPYSNTGSSGLYSNESLLAHNFFDIQPSLTDDRRPPPSITRPSPELRRYLNPQMASGAPDSPTQLHFWQDERYVYDAKRETKILREKLKQKNNKRRHSPGPRSKLDSLPRVVPLSVCLPPTVRTANASSPPIWLTPDGEPINKNTSSPLLHDPIVPATNGNGMPKNREPRENRDFLRMYVCEAAMRRSGKLSDDLAAGRARLWLPPIAGFQNNDPQALKKKGAERWQSWTANDMMD